MLVLSRREQEVILVGDDIRIVVLEIRRGQVRLGIDAPPEVKVLREELTGGGCRENKKDKVDMPAHDIAHDLDRKRGQ